MANEKKLAYSVTLWDGATNEYKTFYPGDVLPAWAEGQVRNPRAFVSEASEHPSALVPGRDIPVAGPSQLPYDTDARFVDQPRYMNEGDATKIGYSLAEETLDVVFGGPPRLHDSVAAHAKGDVAFASDAQERVYKVRTGQEEIEAQRLSREAAARDESDARRANSIFEDQQRQVFEQTQAQQADQLAAAQALQMQLSQTMQAQAAQGFEAATTAQAETPSFRAPESQGGGEAKVPMKPVTETQGVLGVNALNAPGGDTLKVQADQKTDFPAVPGEEPTPAPEPEPVAEPEDS